MKLLILKKEVMLSPFLKRCSALLLFLFLSTTAYAQLTVTVVTKTDETCPGNGTATLTAQNAQPGEDVYYLVYQLPDTSTPVWNSTNGNVTALTDGNYQAVAQQTIGGNPVTSNPVNFVIEDHTQPVTFTLTATDEICINDASITVNVTGGTPLTYEIINGPVTAPPQASNVFTGLPDGTFTVRVNDNCGFGVPQAITIFTATPDFELAPNVIFPNPVLDACDEIKIANIISLLTPDIPFNYPMDATFTIYPPDGGAPIVIEGDVMPTPDPNVAQAVAIIPFYYNENYTYELVVTDGCTTVGPIEYNINPRLNVLALFDNANCDGKKLILQLSNFLPPYTVEFDSFPAGFDPLVGNPAHPGPYTEIETEYGDEDNEVPYGTYTGTIEDACGHTRDFEIIVEEIPVIPVSSPSNADCATGLGDVEITIPGIGIATAYITAAPQAYVDLGNPLPDDVMEFYDPDPLELMITIPDLPPGDYIVELVDVCGVVYEPEEFTVGTATQQPAVNPRPDCEEGFGAMAISSYNPPLSSVIITDAPDGFPETLPFDASEFIAGNGVLYMDGLTPGTYDFEITDGCATTTQTKVVAGYTVSEHEVEVTLHCGSFDLYLHHASNASNGLKFWLQRYDPATDTWGHPETGISYTEGDIPVDVNSLQLANNTTVYSMPYQGDFRIIKSFTTYGSGVNTKSCITIVEESFTVDDALDIVDIINISCDGEDADVQVIAEGVQPLLYKITEKNGEPFIIDNGENNTFFDLEQGYYRVTVTDPCGHSVPMNFNVNDLPSLVNAYPAPDLYLCDTDSNGEETFDLSQQTPFIIGTQDPDVTTVTYHASQANADNGTAPLPLNFTIGNYTVYARVINSTNTDCVATTSFNLVLQQAPVLNMDDVWPMCEGESVVITVDDGYDSYVWSTGATSRSIVVSEAGSYTVTATIASTGCEASKTVNVVTSAVPHIAEINISDWTSVNNTITVVTEASSAPQNFEYSLDNSIWQNSPVFEGLAPGPYTVYVRDELGCGEENAEVYLLTYPKFFTPNGDGINETWRIQFSYYEPDMQVYIYDRFGKLITAFGSNHNGWDGTYNGVRLPATDYWFVVKRQDGRELKGHFSMVR